MRHILGAFISHVVRTAFLPVREAFHSVDKAIVHRKYPNLNLRSVGYSYMSIDVYEALPETF